MHMRDCNRIGYPDPARFYISEKNDKDDSNDGFNWATDRVSLGKFRRAKLFPVIK